MINKAFSFLMPSLMILILLIFAAEANSSDSSGVTGNVDNSSKALGVTSFTNTEKIQLKDFSNATSMELPLATSNSLSSAKQEWIDNFTSSVLSESNSESNQFSIVERGAIGNGKLSPITVPVNKSDSSMLLSAAVETQTGDFISQGYGTSYQPFTTVRADNSSPTNTSYPFRASGKLFFKIGGSTYVCSASLIKKGVIVTAAHCVAQFGMQKFYSGWQFIPGYRNGSAPYGTWEAQTAYVVTKYFDGTDDCNSGVVCRNDIAVIVLKSKNRTYPGTNTGWYGYNYGDWGFTPPEQLTQITQIGYPVGLDNGLLMQRNDSYGFRSASLFDNTVIGSNMNGGSSGGPWINNFGYEPVFTGQSSTINGNANIIIGVTSWGYTDSGVKQQGASPFTSDNIGSLVNSACSSYPSAC